MLQSGDKLWGYVVGGNTCLTQAVCERTRGSEGRGKRESSARFDAHDGLEKRER